MDTIEIDGCIVPVARSPLDSARGRRTSRGHIRTHTRQYKQRNTNLNENDNITISDLYDSIVIINTITNIPKTIIKRNNKTYK